jgi:E3 ubiquitin-protein ligase BAH
MKFAKQLETEAEDIPTEWRPFLLQYKALKKLVAKVAKEIQDKGLSATLLHESLEIKPCDDQTQRRVPRMKYYFIGFFLYIFYFELA